MKKNLSISCILLAVVTMFGLYCYRERENKNLVASIEPYTETAVILSDYIDFEKSIYIGHKSDHEILILQQIHLLYIHFLRFHNPKELCS